MKINTLLTNLVTLVKIATNSKDVELFYLPEVGYSGYIVVPNEIQNTKIENVYYITGVVVRHIEVGKDINSEFNLATKESSYKFKDYTSKYSF